MDVMKKKHLNRLPKQHFYTGKSVKFSEAKTNLDFEAGDQNFCMFKRGKNLIKWLVFLFRRYKYEEK